MLTILSNARNTSLYLIAAVGILLAGLLAKPFLPSLSVSRPAAIPVTGSHEAQELFRSEELALYNRPAASSIGSPAFYAYRQAEWSTAGMSASEVFRHEELSLYSQRNTSSIGSPSFFDYRRGEWSTGGMSAAEAFRHEELALYDRQAASSIGSPSFYDYRRGEWFGE